MVEKYNVPDGLQNKINRINELCDNIFNTAFNQNIANVQHDKTRNFFTFIFT